MSCEDTANQWVAKELLWIPENLAIILFLSCPRTESGRARGGADTGKTKMRPATLISVNDLILSFGRFFCQKHFVQGFF